MCNGTSFRRINRQYFDGWTHRSAKPFSDSMDLALLCSQLSICCFPSVTMHLSITTTHDKILCFWIKYLRFFSKHINSFVEFKNPVIVQQMSKVLWSRYRGTYNPCISWHYCVFTMCSYLFNYWEITAWQSMKKWRQVWCCVALLAKRRNNGPNKQNCTSMPYLATLLSDDCHAKITMKI